METLNMTLLLIATKFLVSLAKLIDGAIGVVTIGLVMTSLEAWTVGKMSTLTLNYANKIIDKIGK